MSALESDLRREWLESLDARFFIPKPGKPKEYRWEGRKENAELAKAFTLARAAKGKRLNTLKKIPSHLAFWSQLLDKPFSAVERSDLEAAVNLAYAKLKPAALNSYLDTLKSFYAWHLHSPKRHLPELVSWIENAPEELRDFKRGDLVEAPDLSKLLALIPHSLDKAMHAVAWATGARPGELVALRICDYARNPETGLMGVFLNGTKTSYSKRHVPIVDAEVARLLEEWIAAHPARNNPDAALWVAPNGQPIGYNYYLLSVRRFLPRIGKPPAPYLYRYSRITLWANDVGLSKLTRALFAYLIGWSARSRYIDHYLRTDQTDAFRVFAGNLRDEKTKTDLVAAETIQLMLAVLSNPKVAAAAEEAFKDKMPEAAARWRNIVERTVDAEQFNAEIARQRACTDSIQKNNAGEEQRPKSKIPEKTKGKK